MFGHTPFEAPLVQARKIGVDDYDIGLLKEVFRHMNRRTR